MVHKIPSAIISSPRLCPSPIPSVTTHQHSDSGQIRPRKIALGGGATAQPVSVWRRRWEACVASSDGGVGGAGAGGEEKEAEGLG